MHKKFEMLPLVDMDGILTEDERRRIIKRLHMMLSWVGSTIPEKEVIQGKSLDLRKIISEFISKPEITKADIQRARLLARGISEREHFLEEVIIHGDISEEEALLLLEEAKGLLRAMEELENIQDRAKAIKAKETILKRVDDEKRWQQFVDKVKG